MRPLAYRGARVVVRNFRCRQSSCHTWTAVFGAVRMKTWLVGQTVGLPDIPAGELN